MGKQEIADDELELQDEKNAMHLASNEEFEPDTLRETPEEKEGIDVPVIKQEVIETPTKSVLDTTKSVLDTAELESILAKGNFTSSVVDQINHERRKTPRELDMAELNT